MLEHETNLSVINKIEILLSNISDHIMKVEINCKIKVKKKKYTNMWRLNNMLLNNKFITEEIKEKLKKYLKTKENENIVGQNLREAAKQL